MKLFRRVLCMFLCFGMLLSLPALWAGAKGAFVIRGSQAACHAAELVSVDIRLENNPGISALNLYYRYDQEYLTLKLVDNRVSAFTMTDDVTTVWDAASNYTGDGILATLVFEVAQDAPEGDYEIGIGFLSAANDDFEEVSAITEAAMVTVKPRGCQLKGKAVSGGSAEENVTLQLFPSGSSTPYQTFEGKGNVFDYAFRDVAPGTYTLLVSKRAHVTRSYTLRVEGTEVTLDAKLCLIGDVDGSGQINVGDVARLYGHIRGTAALTDDYQLQCANVNGGTLTIGDVANIYAHIKGTGKLF